MGIIGCWELSYAFNMKNIYFKNVLTWDLDGGSMKKALLVCIAITLTACEAAYKSSELRINGTQNIRVVPLTPDTVLEANSSPYEPLKLPQTFSSIEKSESQYQRQSTTLGRTLNFQKSFGEIKTGLPKTLQPQPYQIGVGDVINFSTKESVGDALSGLLARFNKRQGFTVQDDGAVSIPDIGRVVVGGLTLEEAEDAVYRQFVEEGVTPSFSIDIAEFNSQSVSVVGAIVSPGIEPIVLQPLYLDEVISRRGGIDINDTSFVVIQLYRNGFIYQLSVAELYDQNRLFKILLKDGDRIVVRTTDEYNDLLGLRQKARYNAINEKEMEMEARSNASRSVQIKLQYGAIPREYVYIIGEVGSQSRFTLPFEDKAVLADAILESGGISSLFGNPKQIYLLRGGDDQMNSKSIVAMHLDASNVANFLLATRLELRPKDVVFVGTQPITNWNRIIQQIIPSLQISNK